jgi:quercetin dioxygenase-like cupin family protein
MRGFVIHLGERGAMTTLRSLGQPVVIAAAWAMILGASSAMSQSEGTGGRCVPVSERAGRELGCFVMASNSLGRLGQAPIYWHIDTYPSRAAAEAAKGPRGTVVQSLGKVWLFTIAEPGWRPTSGERVAEIGPLPIDADAAYTAVYMEAVFEPGMKSAVHRHSGPEAWYTLTGETCLETPEGTMIGRAGGEYVIVPGGPPMELTATGKDVRRAEVLILHDSAKPPGSPAPDWQPKGLCRKSS